ncbi:hypothetical protein ACA910_016801 [Epithemia clementina (nom. ined.)]
MATNNNEDNPQAGAGRPLPKKEADLFRSLVKQHEMKQYKKAVRQANTILKKYPNHGETLAMKGLTLSYMSKREEAHELVKLGLRNDLRSHVCWHVLGLLHRSDRNYDQAIKAYKQALGIDPHNQQILRDLSFLQIQMRDLDGFAVSRNTLLTLKSNAKINWIAFALARHLTGDLEGAVKVIDTYLGTLSEGSPELGRCYESSELAMYRNSILAQMPNNYQAALDHLDSVENIVVDRAAWLEKKTEYRLKLDLFEEAKQTIMEMFERGMTENHRVHSFYMCAVLNLGSETTYDELLGLKGTQTLASHLRLTPEQKETLREAYANELLPAFSNSHAVQRIPIAFLEGEELRKALDGRCRKDLMKGVPSLCAELCSYLYVLEGDRFVKPRDPVDVKEHPVFQMVVGMASDYIANLELCSKLHADDECKAPQSTLLWAWFLRAGLHESAGEYEEGIKLLDKCLEDDSLEVDIYELKARLLKASGDVHAAVECLDKGRELDQQDRYINNQTTKHMLQAGMEDEALKRISLFTRHEGNAEQNLYDMQCSWYELELADCLARKQDWGRSLKKFTAVVKHFEDFNEDQFDFHAYCLRKITLRAYVSVLRFEDELYGLEYYCRAAAGIIRIYLHLLDHPEQDETKEPDYSKMTAAEKRKAKSIARQKKAAEKKAEDAKEQNKQAKGGKTTSQDDDPMGKELLKKDALEEAAKFSGMLARYAPRNLETWTLRYDVAIRRKKTLMALQALYKARAISPDNSEVFSRIVDFCNNYEGLKNGSDLVREVLDNETPPLLNSSTLADYVRDAAVKVRKGINREVDYLDYRCSVAQALVSTKSSTVAEASALILESGAKCRGAQVETCRRALGVLKSFGDEASDATKLWISCVKERFPRLLKLE